MNEILITKSIVTYTSYFHGSEQDKSWKLDLENVVVVGGINRMDGDDDSDFVVFIDRNQRKYFLNLTWEIKGFNSIAEECVRRFGFDLTTWSHFFHDADKVLFPEKLKDLTLYQTSLIMTFKTLFGCTHRADGLFSKEVKRYFEEREKEIKKNSEPAQTSAKRLEYIGLKKVSKLILSESEVAKHT